MPKWEPHFAIAYEELSFDCLQFFSPFPDQRHAHLKSTMAAFQEKLHPDLIVVDALREVHAADVRVSGQAKRVYDAFKSIFPQSAVLFIHHDTKETEIEKPDLERAAGSQEWGSHATVAMRMVESGGVLWLRHTKSQASEKYDPLPLNLINGLYVENRDVARNATLLRILEEMKDAPRGAVDRRVAVELGISPRRALTLRRGIEQEEMKNDRT